MNSSDFKHSAADDSGRFSLRVDGGINKGKMPSPPPTHTDKGLRIAQAEARITQANIKTDEANARTSQADLRAEKAIAGLRTSELSYRRLFEAARDGILILDAATGRITDVNPFLVELLGYSRDEMLGKTVGALSPVKDLLSNQAMLARLQEDGYSRYEDLPLETRSGHRVAVEFVSNVYQAGTGKVIQCNIRDITARKLAEEAVRANEAVNRTGLDDVMANIAVVDKHGTIVTTNEGWEQFALENVYAPQSLKVGVGVNYLEVCKQAAAGLGDEAQAILNGIKAVLAHSQATFKHEYSCHSPTELRWFSMQVSRLNQAAGGAVIAHFNITERKLAEVDLVIANKEMLFQNEEKEKRAAEMRQALATLDATEEGVFIFDPETLCHTYVNAGAVQQLGYAREELLGMTPLSFKPEFNEARHREMLAPMLRGEVRAHRFVTRHRHKDGAEFPVEINLQYVAPVGERPRFIAIARDITARKQAESVKARTHHALRVLTEFGHELMRSTSEQALLNDTCRIVVEAGGYRMAWVGYAEHDTRKTIRPMAQAGFAKDYFSCMTLTWAKTKFSRGPGGEAIRTGQPCVCRNVLKDPRFAPWRTEALKRGYASALALPLVVEQGCLGVLAVYSEQSDVFDEDEVQLFQQLANDLSFGIMALRGGVERKELERHVLHIAEHEQYRIGQDLHDGVGQSIIGIGFLISAVQQTLICKSPPAAAELERIIQIVWKAVQQVRDMALGLFPLEMGNGQITEALIELARHTQDVFGTPCRFSGRTTVRMVDGNVANQVYRIAQEALNNAAKHSKAKMIQIRLSQRRDRMILTVRDTGVGIVKTKGKSAGMGQRIMKYRANMIGATLKVESARGKGTTVTCMLPARGRPHKEFP